MRCVAQHERGTDPLVVGIYLPVGRTIGSAILQGVVPDLYKAVRRTGRRRLRPTEPIANRNRALDLEHGDLQLVAHTLGLSNSDRLHARVGGGDRRAGPAASALLMTETVPLAQVKDLTDADPFTMMRVARDREAATARYLHDRDMTALQRAMERLDTDEEEARARPREVVTAALARHYLSNLAELWRDTQPEGRRAIAEAAFDRIDALGPDLIVHPSAEAERYGWSEAFGSEPLVCSIGCYGRGERI